MARLRWYLVVAALAWWSPSMVDASPDGAPLFPVCGLEDPAIAARAPVVARKRRETPGLAITTPPVWRQASGGSIGHGAEGGVLSGKTVYLSPGHGLTYLPGTGWRPQRPNTHDLVEDFISVETVSYYLVRHLRNMGAYVVPVRELDTNWNKVVVDDEDANFAIEGQASPSSGPVGFATLSEPITGSTNPFTSGGSTEFPTSQTDTGRAVWTFNVAVSGEYNVYVGFVQGPDRASDAHYIVMHAGGETHFRVDQRRHGSTWVLLGSFYFEAGMSPIYGAVALANDSVDAGTVVSADVARIGGGMESIDRGGGVSGRPMFETNARYYAQLAGAPPSVYDYTGEDRQDDVGTRSRFAAWEHEDGEDAVYVAWHTNAPSPGRGTSSFAYGPNAFGTVADFTGVPGSLELMDAIHTELVGDLQTSWESDWNDRGQHTAYFGEINPNHNPETPAVLLEVAFHDTLDDANSLRDPRFRYLATRAIAQGIARYFTDKDGTPLDLPPEPPTAPLARNSGSGVQISWRPPNIDPAGGDPPDAYRVYLSADGLGFDDGRTVNGASFEIAAAPGEAVYARITALNAGGESFPSPVVGARVDSGGRASVLVVSDYDRLDGGQLIRDDLSDFALDTIERGFIERINDGSYVARHGAAIDASGFSFDSATSAAVVAGDIDLDDYVAIDWFTGENDLASGVISIEERDVIDSYLAGGGKLFVSGTDVALALDDQGNADERAFLRDALGAAFVADDADTYDIVGSGGVLSDIGPLSFGDFGAGSYDADSPDVLAPSTTAIPVLSYAGAGGVAATWWTDPVSGTQVMVAGFPFATIVGAENRAQLMKRILAGFGVLPDTGIPPPGTPVDPGCWCSVGSSPRSGGSGGWLLWGLVLLWLARPRQRLAHLVARWPTKK